MWIKSLVVIAILFRIGSDAAASCVNKLPQWVCTHYKNIGVCSESHANAVYARENCPITCGVPCAPSGCSIEVKPYSAYGPDEGCTPHEGYVKLNGDTVWEGGWCSSVPGKVGTNLLLVDPVACTVSETHRFDTHHSAADATHLDEYLKKVTAGQLLVGVSADEPSANLRIAVHGLQKIGVDVGDVHHRGSFGFVAEKGFPDKTVMRKAVSEEMAATHPPHFTATVTGTGADMSIEAV